MLNTILQYRELIEKSFSISQGLLLSTALEQVVTEKESLLTDLQEEKGIKVPLVGDFSAGKSSLVNTLLNRNGLLPVDITPETAVAYEIYYAPQEVVELYREGKKIEERPIHQIKSLAVRPGDIAKVYVNVPVIQQLQDRGIILVDMPGIDSGIKEHNDAILHYINKGSAFILLTDCEQGSLRESTLSFITELSKYNLKPAVLISKIDKKPESEIKDIKEYVEFQAKRAIGEETYVGCVSSANNNIADLTNFLNTLDGEALVSSKFANRIAAFISLQIVSISTQRDLLNANIQDVEEKIKNLEAEKQRIAAKLADSVPYADTPEKSTQDILDQVKMELDIHAEDIAQKVVDKEDANTINAMMMNIIRPVVINAFKDEGEQYASAMNTVVDDVSKALQDSLSIEGNFVDDIVDNMRSEIIGAVQIAAETLKLGGPIGTVIGWVLTFVGEKIPDIIRWFFGKSKASILQEATEKIRESIIGQIVEKLRPMIFEQVKAQQERIRQNIQKRVSDSISSLQESIQLSNERGTAENLQTKMAIMETAINELNQLKQTLK